jgi:hypothetical protein
MRIIKSALQAAKGLHKTAEPDFLDRLASLDLLSEAAAMTPLLLAHTPAIPANRDAIGVTASG